MESNCTNLNITQAETSQNVNMNDMAFRVTKIIFYVIIFLLSCVGNTLVAFIILGARDMRTPSNFLILNLALCDLITPAVDIPFDFALEESKYIWRFGEALCKLVWPVETVFSIASSLTLAVISLERLKTLSHPFARRLQMHHAFVLIMAIYTFSISLCVPYILVLDYSDVDLSCDEHWPNIRSRQAYTIVLCLCEYVLPLTTMAVAYVFIYRSLRSNLLKLIKGSSANKRQRYGSKTSQSATMGIANARKEQNTHLAKMFVIVVVVFAISMLPNQILWLWVDFGNGKDHENLPYISVVCRLCTYANSVLNPFIYALKSTEFRSGFKRIGRAGMRSFRTISNRTTKYTYKVTDNNSNNQHRVPKRSSPLLKPLQKHQDADIICFDEVYTSRKERKTNPTIQEDFPWDLTIPEIVLCANLLKGLRETDC